jgi:predicted DNA-binding protein YlxM (UPF0122 family)
MNRETFLNIYNNKLMPDHKEILPLILEGFSNKEIVEKQNVTPSAVSHRIKVIAEKFDCVSREDLIEIFAKYKPEVVGRKLLENYPNLVQPHFPDRPEPIDSSFYIERDRFESNLDSLLTESLIRITAPRKIGKTSLLKRIVFHCKSKGWHTVYLNLSQVEDSKLQKEEDFIRLFYNSIIQELLSLSPSNEWDRNLSTMTNCTTNFQGLLKKLNTNFALVMDEVDRLFEYPAIYKNFFPLLRHWYEKTNESNTWSKLKLVMAYSTEDYGKLDIDQSPLNVGRAIKLQEFTPLQVQNLASRHRLERGKIYPLINLVGGHPFLYAWHSIISSTKKLLWKI